MKIKEIIIALGLIITMFFSGEPSEVNRIANETENLNTVSSEEIIIQEEQNVIEDEQIIEDNEIEEQVIIVEEQKKIVEEKKQETTQIQKDTPKVDKLKISSETEQTKQEQKTEIKAEQEEKTENINQVPKEETPKQTILTPSDLEYWCVAGGEHHIAGDRENEHGYYSSWNEANQAFESYTKGWDSVQYKISQCSCGLYYFWAIK